MGEREERSAGPYILWYDYGYEGWAPYSFMTFDDAMEHARTSGYGSTFVITKRVIVTELAE